MNPDNRRGGGAHIFSNPSTVQAMHRTSYPLVRLQSIRWHVGEFMVSEGELCSRCTALVIPWFAFSAAING
jgi:hypothetical protein